MRSRKSQHLNNRHSDGPLAHWHANRLPPATGKGHGEHNRTQATLASPQHMRPGPTQWTPNTAAMHPDRTTPDDHTSGTHTLAHPTQTHCILTHTQESATTYSHAQPQTEGFVNCTCDAPPAKWKLGRPSACTWQGAHLPSSHTGSHQLVGTHTCTGQGGTVGVEVTHEGS